MVENKTKEASFSDTVGVAVGPPLVFATNAEPVIVASAPAAEEGVFATDPETGVTVSSAVTEETTGRAHADHFPSKTRFLGDGNGTVTQEEHHRRRRTPNTDATSTKEQQSEANDTKSPFHYLFLFLFYMALIWPLAFISGVLWVFITPFASLTCNMSNHCVQNILGGSTKRLIQLLLQGQHGPKIDKISNIVSSPSSESMYDKSNAREEEGIRETSQGQSNAETTPAQTSQSQRNEDSKVPLESTTNAFHALMHFVFLSGIVWPQTFLCVIMWVFVAPFAGLFKQNGLHVVQFFEDRTLALVRSLGGK